jgi:hypothetical protein
MRDTTALLQARAKKVPTLARLVERITDLTEEEIAAAPIKESDRKLLRKAKPNATRLERVRAIVNAMPTHDVTPEVYRVFVYKGPETAYHSFEVPTGTVITYGDEWVRFDHYRIKQQSSIDHLLKQSEEQEPMEIGPLNRFIAARVNARHGLSSTEETGSNDRLYITSASFRA